MRNLILSLAALLAFPLAASAATINVNSTADTLVAADGQCTLREAIISANGDSDTTGGDCAAGSGADLINVPAGNYLPSGLYALWNLTLRGAGAAMTVIDLGGPTSDVVAIGVTIERVSIENGGSLGAPYDWPGPSFSVVDSVISGFDSGGPSARHARGIASRSTATPRPSASTYVRHPAF